MSIGIGYHFSPEFRFPIEYMDEEEEDDLADDIWGSSLELEYQLDTGIRFRVETSPFGYSEGETREEGEQQAATTAKGEIPAKEKAIRKAVERALEHDGYRKFIEKYGTDEVKKRLKEALKEREKKKKQQAEGGGEKKAEKKEEAKTEPAPDPGETERKREQIEKSVRKALRDPAYRRMIEQFGSEDVKEAVRRAVDAQQSAGG